MADDFQADIRAVRRIEAVPTILETICRTTGMGFAAVACATDGRWIVCDLRDGLGLGLQPDGELKTEIPILQQVLHSRKPVVINHLEQGEIRPAQSASTLDGIQSYISVPIVLSNGSFFGILCAMDRRPAQLDKPEILDMFTLFAQLISVRLAAGAQKAYQLREEFIGVLAHDLRNPLAAIDAGMQLLARMALDEKAARVVGRVQASAARMASLIKDVLDFARALRGGLTLNRDAEQPLEPVLSEAINAFRINFPKANIESEFHFLGTIDCDTTRMAQLLSHLLDTAMSYGMAGKPIRVHAATAGEFFELSVSYAGEPIPQAVMEGLFSPFSQAASGPRKPGLGLGIYIASEIAKAHGGVLEAASSPEETRFKFRMPIRNL